MWLVERNSILTKDNLTRKKWKGDKKCAFCNEEETIEHLFFKCDVSGYVWSIVAWTVGARCRPESIEQYKLWISHYMPQDIPFSYDWSGSNMLGHLEIKE